VNFSNPATTGGTLFDFSNGGTQSDSLTLGPTTNSIASINGVQTIFGAGSATGALGFRVGASCGNYTFQNSSGVTEFAILASTGFVSSVSALSTTGSGVAPQYATVDLTAQTAAIPTTTLLAINSADAGQWRLAWDAKVTTAATTSSTLGALTITYVDPDGTTQTITASAHNSAGTGENSDSANTTTSPLLGNSILLNCKASTNITYAFAYASSGATPMAYNLHIKLEFMK